MDLSGAPVGPATVPAPPGAASAPLRLDLPTNGPMSPRRAVGLLPLLKPPADKEGKLEKDIDKAKRADCRDAHSESGLLAVVPIAIDAISGKGCKF